MAIVAFVTDPLAIRRILDYLGLSPRQPGPPPPVREVTVVPVEDETESWSRPEA